MDLTPTNLNLSNSLETITLNEQTNNRLMEIGKIKDYFSQEIQHQQSLTSKLGKYLTFFDYTDKILTVFFDCFFGTNIFAHVKGRKQLLGLITSIFSLRSCLSSDVVKKLHQETKLIKKKHNRLLYLAKNKLDCVEMLISNSIKDGIIDHEEFLATIKEKKQYDNEKMKVNCVKLRLFKNNSWVNNDGLPRSYFFFFRVLYTWFLSVLKCLLKMAFTQ